MCTSPADRQVYPAAPPRILCLKTDAPLQRLRRGSAMVLWMVSKPRDHSFWVQPHQPLSPGREAHINGCRCTPGKKHLPADQQALMCMCSCARPTCAHAQGLQESMDSGPLAGFPVVDVCAVLEDGSYHDVDSSALAFQVGEPWRLLRWGPCACS